MGTRNRSDLLHAASIKPSDLFMHIPVIWLVRKAKGWMQKYIKAFYVVRLWQTQQNTQKTTKQFIKRKTIQDFLPEKSFSSFGFFGKISAARHGRDKGSVGGLPIYCITRLSDVPHRVVTADKTLMNVSKSSGLAHSFHAKVRLIFIEKLHSCCYRWQLNVHAKHF